MKRRIWRRGPGRASSHRRPRHRGAFTALGSDALALLPRTFARYCAATLELRIVEIPLDLPSVAVAQAWHQRLDADPASGWLRRTVAEAVRRHSGEGARYPADRDPRVIVTASTTMTTPNPP